MKSELPKVMVEIAGRPMIEFVLDALRAAGIESIYIVVGYRSDLVRSRLAGQQGLGFVEQREQLGTGHAVMACRDQLAGHEGGVLIVAGDSPMIQTDSVRALLSRFDRGDLACLLGTLHKEDPTGLGRIVRDADGRFAAIVEEKDATPAQRQLTEVNMSTYVFDCQTLLAALAGLTANNAAREYYITDCPSILKKEGKAVEALAVLKPCEALSINTPEELALVEVEMRNLR